MDDWSISKSLGKCFGTGRQILPSEEYFAALVETEQGLQRRDFNSDYWNTNKPVVYCFWKTRMAQADQGKRMFVDDDMLMSFFERLAAETEQERINFRFVIMLILMRKRRLKYDLTKIENGREIWRLRITGSDQYVDVVNPHLDQGQIEQLSTQIGQILQADL